MLLIFLNFLPTTISPLSFDDDGRERDGELLRAAEDAEAGVAASGDDVDGEAAEGCGDGVAATAWEAGLAGLLPAGVPLAALDMRVVCWAWAFRRGEVRLSNLSQARRGGLEFCVDMCVNIPSTTFYSLKQILASCSRIERQS